MTTNIEFNVKDSTTLADFKELLKELQLNPLFEIGGEEGSIQYDFEGHVWIYDLEDGELKKVLNIILKNPNVKEDSYVVLDGCDTIDVETLRRMVL